MARKHRISVCVPGAAKWLAILLGAGLLLAWQLEQHEALVTIHLDHAQDLRVGDGVYLRNLRIGSVHHIESHGYRTEIRLAIPRRFLGKISPDCHFVLYQDEHQAHRRSILVIPGSSG